MRDRWFLCSRQDTSCRSRRICCSGTASQTGFVIHIFLEDHQRSGPSCPQQTGYPPTPAGAEDVGKARGASANEGARHRRAVPYAWRSSRWRSLSRPVGRGCPSSRHSPKRPTIGGIADWYAVVALFKPAARPADPAHGHHPGKPDAHRRQSRPFHRGEFPGARAGAREAAGGRFRGTRGGLAFRPGAGRRPVALRHASRSADADGRRAIRTARLRQAAHACGDREGEGRRRSRPTSCRPSPQIAGIRSCSTNSPKWSAAS